METWVNVKNYEDYYQVSNLGKVRSKDRTVASKGGFRLHKGRELSQNKTNGNGYKTVQLSVEGKRVPKYFHRLVAEAFVPNPNNKKEVNHINGDKSDNRAENLEWCTSQENKDHARKTGLSACVMVTYAGETLTLQEWSPILEVSVSKLRSRYERHGTLDKPKRPAPKPRIFYKYKGRIFNMHQLSKLLNRTSSTIRERIKRGTIDIERL